MGNQISTLGDLISPETKNILEKYKRLSSLCKEMGIDGAKSTDLLHISEVVPKLQHKNKEEAINLVNKLIKIQKK